MPVDMFPKILTQIRRIPISFIFVHIYYKNIGEALQICHLVNKHHQHPSVMSLAQVLSFWPSVEIEPPTMSSYVYQSYRLGISNNRSEV